MGLQGPDRPRRVVRLFQRPEGNSFFSFSLWSLAFQLLYTFPTREKSFRLRRSPPRQPLTHDWYGLTAIVPAIFNPQGRWWNLAISNAPCADSPRKPFSECFSNMVTKCDSFSDISL